MFPSSNRTNNHLLLDTNNIDLRFFDNDELLDHIFWQEQLMVTSDEVSKSNNAIADDVREEVMEEKQYQKTKERKGSRESRVSPPPRRRTGKKDRHSKIRTANGLRDRRIRLSVQVSKKFFELHDMLGFDKASTTLDWLFLKSKEAIKDLTKSSRRSSSSERIVNQVNNIGGGAGGGSRGGKGLSSASESDVISNDAEDDGSENMFSIGEGASSSVPKRRKLGKLCTQSVDLVKIRDSRMKARARARERTREKMMGKGLGTGPKQACELKDTEPAVGEPNINQETRFLGHTTQELSQIYDDCPIDSPRLFERFLGITSTDVFGPNSNSLYEMITGTEFVAGAMHDLLGYDYDSTTQHHNLNANFIPMSTSEPNPNLMILPSRSIKEQKPTLPMIVDDSQAAGN